jgi:hypothetical protein
LWGEKASLKHRKKIEIHKFMLKAFSMMFLLLDGNLFNFDSDRFIEFDSEADNLDTLDSEACSLKHAASNDIELLLE